MEKIRFRLVYNRKKSANKNGCALIQIEAYQNRNRTYVSTNIYVKQNQWNKKKQIITNHSNADELNMLLYSSIIELEKKEILLWKQGYSMNPKQIKSILHTNYNESCNSDFSDFMYKCITTDSVCESTRKNRMTTLNLLKDYHSNLRFDMIDIKFIKEFEEWMSSKGYHTNTIAKHLSHLMIYIKKAISCRYIIDKNEAICSRKIQKEPSKHSWLSPEELQKMESYSLNTSLNSKESHVVDAFLFCCYTGLRYSDFIRLSSKNFKSDNNGYWLSFISQKTNVYTKLPLSLLFEGKAFLIYEKYQRNMSDLFAIPSNSLVDKILDKVSVSAGIESHISFHTARHTNATLLIYQGVSITTVQKLLGHKDLKTTSGYCEILDETIIRELKRKKSAHK